MNCNNEQENNDYEVTGLEEPLLIKKIKIGGLEPTVIVDAVGFCGVKIEGGGTRYYLDSPKFDTLPKRQNFDLVKIRLSSLGLNGDCLAYDEIISRANYWGFERCPKETALELFINDVDEVLEEDVFVASEPICSNDLEKTPFILRVNFTKRNIFLTNSSKLGGRGWSQDDEFIFMVPRGVVGEARA